MQRRWGMADMGQDMWRDVRIEPGAAVEASDGRLGTVDEVILRQDGRAPAYVVVRRGWSNEQLLVPAELIRAVNGPREVHLAVTRDEAHARAGDVPAEALLLARDRNTEVVIPIVEERLIPDKRPVDLGELRIHKFVDELEEAVQQPVTRDDLIIERVPINQPIEAPLATRYEGEWMVIPIMREVLVVKKQLMLTEEVRIGKREVTEEQEVREVTRHERLELEDATVHGIPGLAAVAAPNGTDAPGVLPSGERMADAAGQADWAEPAREVDAGDVRAAPADIAIPDEALEHTAPHGDPLGTAGAGQPRAGGKRGSGTGRSSARAGNENG